MTQKQYKKLAKSNNPDAWITCFRWRMAQKAEGARISWESLYEDLCGMGVYDPESAACTLGAMHNRAVWEAVQTVPGALDALRTVAEKDLRSKCRVTPDGEVYGRIARKGYTGQLLRYFLTADPDWAR